MEQTAPPQRTALAVWLWSRRLTDRQFANMMAKQLNVQEFSSRTVEKWRYGGRIPSVKNLKAIKEITGLTADELLA